MFGQIIKKLLNCLFFNVIYAIFLLVVAYVWGLITKGTAINKESIWNYVGILLATLLIELLAVYFIRIDNKERKEAYEKEHKDGPVAFKQDFVRTLKTQDTLIHTIVFDILLLPIMLMLCIGNQISTAYTVLIAVGAFLVSFVLFAVISTCLWCIVHRRWLSTKPPKDFEKMWNAILNRVKGK